MRFSLIFFLCFALHSAKKKKKLTLFLSWEGLKANINIKQEEGMNNVGMYLVWERKMQGMCALDEM